MKLLGEDASRIIPCVSVYAEIRCNGVGGSNHPIIMQEIHQVDFADCPDPIAAVRAYLEEIEDLCIITDDDVEVELWATDEGKGKADGGVHVEDVSDEVYSLEMEVREAMGCCHRQSDEKGGVMDFVKIIKKMEEHFRGKADQIALFLNPPRNMEGWFSGEVLTVLDNLKADYWPEVRYDKGEREICDYILRLGQQLVGVEIKTAFSAKQGSRYLDRESKCIQTLEGQTWKLEHAYYAKAVAIDAKRLAKNDDLIGCYCLVFAYGSKDLINVNKFKAKLDVQAADCDAEVSAYPSGQKTHSPIQLDNQNVLYILAYQVKKKT